MTNQSRHATEISENHSALPQNLLTARIGLYFNNVQVVCAVVDMVSWEFFNFSLLSAVSVHTFFIFMDIKCRWRASTLLRYGEHLHCRVHKSVVLIRSE